MNVNIIRVNLMKSIKISFIILLLLAGIFLNISGCVSKQNSSINHQSPPISAPQTTYPEYWIHIDPIRDFKTDSSFNITGSSSLNVSGTTDFPSGSILNLYILEEDKSRQVLKTTVQIKGNNSGPNSFYYTYDMKGNPPGQYRAIISDNINLNGEFSHFAITTDSPYLRWIQMDPLGNGQLGGILPVSGTTDLPEGSEIQIRSDIVYQSCTMATPDLFGAKSLCGGSCRDTGSQKIILVHKGAAGINVWNSTIDTSDWCKGEEYRIGAYAANWTNVTPGGQSIRLRS
jgi:hypothetical protein